MIQLQSREIAVIELRHKEISFREIGEKWGISGQRAQQILAAGVRKINGNRQRRNLRKLNAYEVVQIGWDEALLGVASNE
jgi:DNA-directed RNA polymerase sigma subunit (sigma70/sigma32)